MKRNLVLSIVFCFAFSAITFAQINMPQPSPSAKLEQMVGLTTVMVEYSRPSVKGRVVFGEENEKSLEKFGKIWRTGANSATKVTFSDDVKINGKMLEKGAYALLTVPGEKGWKIHFYPYASGNWSSYVEKTPTLETTVLAVNNAKKVETFTIDVNSIKTNSANLTLAWDRFYVMIPMEVTVDERVMEDIAATMAGPTPYEHYQAATYYHDAGKDLNQALTWIQKANALDAKYWTLRREALILADLEMYGEAVETAKKSMNMAEEAGNAQYVRMNKESIAAWSKNVKPGMKRMKKAEKAKVAPKSSKMK